MQAAWLLHLHFSLYSYICLYSLCIPTFLFIFFVFLHSFVFQLVLRFSALCSPSWTSRRVCSVQLPLLFLVQPYSCQPQLLEAKPERRRAERKLRATRLHTHKRIYSFTPPSSYTMRKLHSSSLKSKHALHPNSYNARSQTSGLKPSH